MLDQIKASINRVVQKGYDFAAGDLWIYVDPVKRTVTSRVAGPFGIVAGTKDKLKVKLSGGSSQTFTLGAGSNVSANTLATTINLTAQNLTASATEDGRLLLSATDPAARLEIEAVAHDCYSVLDLLTTQTSLLTVDWSNAQARAEGLEIFGAGVEDQDERILVFLKTYLAQARIVAFDPAGYFLRLNERFDFQTDLPIRVHSGTSEDSSNLIWFTVRKAIETEHTVPGSDFRFRVD